MRKHELLGSCKSLGIHDQRCVALDNPALQDNPTVWWDTALIEDIVDTHVRKWEVDAVRCLLSSSLTIAVCFRLCFEGLSH